MKKIITSLLVGATVCAAVVPFSGMINASAGEKQTVFLDEQFGQDALDQTKWSVNGESVELFADKETGYLNMPRNLEVGHVGIKNEIKNLDYMQFDLKFLSKKWMALYFKPEEKTTLGDYAPEMFMNMAGNAEFSSDNLKFSYSSHTINGTMGEWMTMKFKRTSATTMDLYVCERGGDIDSVTPITITIKNAKANFDSFYFAIAGEGGQDFSIDNLIVRSDTVNFEERFYSEKVNDNLKSYGAAYDIINPDSSLTFKASKTGEGVTHVNPVKAETSIIEDLDIMKTKFMVSFANAQAGDSVVYAFGIDEGMTYEDDSYAVVMEKDGVSLIRYEEDAQIYLMDKVEMSLANAVEVQLVANKGGEISLYINNQMVGSCEAMDEEAYYAGSFGFYAANDNAGDISVDTVRTVTKFYKVPVTKSVSHNFSNNFFGNEGYEDFVVNAHSGDKGIYVKDGKLVFDNVADDAYFGAAYEYDNFILDYKLCSVKVGENATGENKWLGLDIGRSVAGKTLYGTHFMLAYTIVPTEASVGVWAYAHDTSELNGNELNKSIVHNKKIPAEYFEAIQYDDVTKMESEVSEKDALCVRYVAENGTVRMYLKRASDPEYELYATISGVETTGYVTLNVTGWTTLKIDDFTMSNISGVYVNADTYAPETVIKDNTIVVYENNVTDPLSFEEVQANTESGCKSVAPVTLCALPLLAGAALVKKNRKDEDQ